MFPQKNELQDRHEGTRVSLWKIAYECMPGTLLACSVLTETSSPILGVSLPMSSLSVTKSCDLGLLRMAATEAIAGALDSAKRCCKLAIVKCASGSNYEMIGAERKPHESPAFGFKAHSRRPNCGGILQDRPRNGPRLYHSTTRVQRLERDDSLPRFPKIELEVANARAIGD
jgi:hypothetical protein